MKPLMPQSVPKLAPVKSALKSILGKEDRPRQSDGDSSYKETIVPYCVCAACLARHSAVKHGCTVLLILSSGIGVIVALWIRHCR